MAGDLETDIDSFIRNQKQKLAQERHELVQEDVPHERKTWDKPSPAKNVTLAEEPKRVPSPETTGLLIGRNSVETRRKKLQEERRREYNDIVNNKPGGRGSRRLPTPDGRSLPVGQGQDETTQKRRVLQEERVQDYNNMIKQKGILSSRKENLPPKAPTPETFLSKLGSHDREKKKLEDERRKEYNQLLQQKAARGEKVPLPRERETLAVPGLSDSKTDQQEKAKSRNEEYNEFLREKERLKGRRNEPPNKHGENVPEPRRHQPPYYATLPGLRYSRSAEEKELKMELNREYREVMHVMNMSDDEASEEPDVKPYSRVSDVVNDGRYRDGPPGAPRTGWTTPTYEEILQKKQQEENKYRRYDEPELTRPGERSFARNQPNGYGDRKALLEDDDWLRPQQMKDDLYNANQPMHSKSQMSPRRPLPEPVGKPRATLLIGHEETSSAKRRKKDAYRHELEQQIQEHQDALKWEKTGDWRVNATGFLDPEKHPDRLRGLPAASDSSHQIQRNDRGPVAPPQSHAPNVMLDYPSPKARSSHKTGINPYIGALDNLNNRTEALLGRRGDLSFSGGGNGILDRGWEGLYDRPRHPIQTVPPPQGYENSSYLNELPGGYNAVNEAYHLYGMRNPLDTYNDPATSLPYDSAPSGGKVRFEDPSYSPRKSDSHRPVLPFPVDDDNSNKSRLKKDTQSYQAELQRQIEEQKMKKKREKAEQERLDKKWEEENRNYNPFGRGGGGAPLKDSTGNTLADLRQLKINGPEPGKSPRAPSHQPASPRLVANSPPLNLSGDATYARGGHGIFGVPKTYEEKSASDKYKDELKQQIEDKRAREAEEKRRILEEEERENRRLQDQQKRIQMEFEEEQRKKREKEEEARKRNEELQKMTEEKKKAAEHQKKELDEKRLQELRERQEEERRQRDRERLAANEQRGKSPVVPALRHKSSATPPPPKPEASPAPAPTENRPKRASSADVLNQLATMRKQLQSERARVENALDRQKNDYEVFDPRLVQRPPAVPRREHDFEIFEGARNRAPVSVRRPPPPESADPAIVDEFNYLKNKGSTDSRREIRKTYPDSPRTSNDLETQQLALIKNQEENLRKPPKQGVYDKAPWALGRRKESPQALLESDSAFIEMGRLSAFPEDFEDLPRRNDSARQRRRAKPETPPRYNPDNYSVQSNVSLDVDNISKKNEERLKRLKQMTGDDVSLADPDDVLDRFMARQRHNRPPSGQTLRDDTWMRPDSRY